MANAFASTKPQLTGSDLMALSQAPAEEPLTNMIAPHPGLDANQSQDETDVYFAFNKWALSDEAKETIKTRIEDKPEGWTGTLKIMGHTDAQGPDAYNKALGLKRAESVKTYLVSLGIPEVDVQVETLGKDGSICQEETPECFEQNRRAHVAFLSSSTPDEADVQLSLIPDALDTSASEEAGLSPDVTEPVSSGLEASLQEEVQEEPVTADPQITVESLP
jgi:outer membrane protein OmpA-like peptidoglycan-associated protein